MLSNSKRNMFILLMANNMKLYEFKFVRAETNNLDL